MPCRASTRGSLAATGACGIRCAARVAATSSRSDAILWKGMSVGRSGAPPPTTNFLAGPRDRRGEVASVLPRQQVKCSRATAVRRPLVLGWTHGGAPGVSMLALRRTPTRLRTALPTLASAVITGVRRRARLEGELRMLPRAALAATLPLYARAMVSTLVAGGGEAVAGARSCSAGATSPRAAHAADLRGGTRPADIRMLPPQRCRPTPRGALSRLAA